MTDLRKAAEMALEALEDIFGKEKKDVGAINALRQALAMENFSEVNQEIEEALKHPEQEPVAWLIQYKTRHDIVWGSAPGLRSNDQILGMEPLYTAPPKREWVGLTSIEIEQLIKACASEEFGFQLDVFVNYINKKFRKMNT
jgi:hypothetical protein